MYIEVIPNRTSPPAILLRESKRVDGKVVKTTLLNLSPLGLELAQQVKMLLNGGQVVMPGDPAFVDPEAEFQLLRSLPHGAVAAVLGMIEKLEIDKLIGVADKQQRKLILAMIVQRILAPGAKLAGARGLNQATADSSLAIELGLDKVDEDDLYEAMDALLPRQDKIEKALAKRHLEDGTLVMYDLTSVWMTGEQCPLAKRGHSRDGKPGTLQIEFGLLCDKEGRPVAVEVFDGNSSDPSTVASQVNKIKNRFGLTKIILVGDRGMLTEARIQEDLKPNGLDWISCLRAPAIKQLAEEKSLQMDLFDKLDLFTITSPDYPGERLVACRNQLLATKRAKVREELLASAEIKLKKAQEATSRPKRALKGVEAITRRLTRILDGSKMNKHFMLEIKADGFTFERDAESIRDEAALDGVYIIRSSVKEEVLNEAELVGSYKNLSRVERAFRTIKTVDLKVRPVYHRLEKRVRSHVFLCMLAYYVEWHMKEALADMLFIDAIDQPMRTNPVAPAEVSDAAKRKAATLKSPDGLPLHSFQTLLKDLATLNRQVISFRGKSFVKYSKPTKLQEKAFHLLGLTLPVPRTAAHENFARH